MTHLNTIRLTVLFSVLLTACPDPSSLINGDEKESLELFNDADKDGVADSQDAFPSDPKEWADKDQDGVGDNSDAFPNDGSETTDADGDGYGDSKADQFPANPNEWKDSDADGVGDNSDFAPDDPSVQIDPAQSDYDGDGYLNGVDAFPADPNEWSDSDGDGVGDNSDAFPNDPAEQLDSDQDGYGDNLADLFPADPLEWSDLDGDGAGDNRDQYDNDPSAVTKATYYTTLQADTNVEPAYAWFGAPSGYADTGFNVYIDFSEKTAVQLPYNDPAPSKWDIVFTYITQSVSMGPMGSHDIPFFDIKINESSGVQFYMKENAQLDLLIEEIKTIEPSLFVTPAHTGYGHRANGDNSKLEDPKYKSVYPYLSYDWYEYIDMKNFDLEHYPGRVFIFKTGNQEYVKMQVIKVYDKSTAGKIYKADFKFHCGLNLDGTFSE